MRLPGKNLQNATKVCSVKFSPIFFGSHQLHFSSLIIAGGYDAINFNSNRSYGRIMLPHLFANWNQIYSTYRDYPEDLTQINAGDFCPNEDDNLAWCYQPMTVLEKPNFTDIL